MTEVELHAYADEARELIKANSYEGAIAICRHILERYPKYIEAYRVLAETCLEKGDYEEAADLFKRVLSADPEDVIAYVGLGIIYEEDELLDEAIWQFERAFELAPGNAEVRSELQRLYAQRDGVERERLKLNKACLGRLYLKGGFYAQAISEFRDILATDPERVDIQLALAEALWNEGRRREAAETCQDILNKMPHCLKANLLLGEIWLRSGLEEEGNTLLRRAQALDPENIVASKLFGEVSPLPRTLVTIERLEEILPAPPLAAVGEEEELAPTEVPGEVERISEEVEEERISPVIPLLEEEFGALPEIGPEEEISEEERAALEAAMPPESATPEEIMAWLRQRQAMTAQEKEEETEPTLAPEASEEVSPVIPALEEEFGALPEVESLEEISEEERAAIEATMPPETATSEEIIAWLRQRQLIAAEEVPAEGVEVELQAKEEAVQAELEEPQEEVAEALIGEEIASAEIEPVEMAVEEELAAEAVAQEVEVSEPTVEEIEAIPEVELAEAESTPTPEIAIAEKIVEEITIPETVVTPEEAVRAEEAMQPLVEAESIEAYLLRLAEEPENHEARLALARAYARMEAWKEAVEQYGVLAQTPSDVLEEVIADLERLTEIYPRELALHQLLGDAYREAGRLEEALAKYNWLLSQV